MTQIVFRIRDTKYKNKAIHIFRETRYSKFITYEDYKARTELLKQDAIKLIDTYNSLSDYGKDKLNEAEINEMYIAKENGIFIIDENLITYDLRNYKLSMSTYASIIKLNEEQIKAGFEGENNSLDIISTAERLKRNKNAKISFKDAFKEYSAIIKAYSANTFNLMSNADNERISYLIEAYEFIKDAYNILGAEEIERLKYNQTSIKERLISLSDIPQEKKIANILRNDININTWYSLEDIKGILQNAYNTINIKKNAKATDLNKYFITEERTKTIKVTKAIQSPSLLDEGNKVKTIHTDVKRAKGLHIISPKYIFN